MSGASANPREGDSGGSSIWNRPARGSRGPAPTHSREAIVVAAIALADADGLAAVSMRAVAAALGTGAGSLYRHLSSRDDLLDLMVDAAVAELRPYPDATGDWLDEMLLVARRQHALYQRHPWLVDAIRRAVSPGPNTLAHFDHCLRVMQPLRCSVAEKFEAIAMVTGIVSLFARSGTAAESPTFAGTDLAAFPHLAAAFTQPTPPTPRQDLFERTLRSLLTGLLTPTPSDRH